MQTLANTINYQIAIFVNQSELVASWLFANLCTNLACESKAGQKGYQRINAITHQIRPRIPGKVEACRQLAKVLEFWVSQGTQYKIIHFKTI